MKVNSYFITKVLVSGIFTFGCSQLPFMKVDTKTQNFNNPRAVTLPTLSDLIVEEVKTSGESSGSLTENINSIKERAVNNALRPSNADLLIEPIFETTTYKGKVTVKVYGYAGRYKNFRTATLEDSSFLKYYIKK